MRTLGQTGGVRLLALIFGLMAASCATQKSAGLDKSSKAGGERQELAKTSTEPDATTKAKVQAVYGKLPLSFEANQGQTDTQVKYLSRGPGYTLLLTSSEAVLALRKPARRDTETQGHGDAETFDLQSPPPSAGRARVRGPSCVCTSLVPTPILR